MDNLSKEARIKIRIVWTVWGILVTLVIIMGSSASKRNEMPISYRNSASSYSSSSSYSSYSSYKSTGSVSVSGSGDLSITGAHITGDEYRPDSVYPYTHYRELGVWGTVKNNGSKDVREITVRVTASPYVSGRTITIKKWIKAGSGASVNFTKDLGVDFGKNPISNASVEIISYK